jgi:hypothetical protein
MVRISRWQELVLIASLFTLLNCFKPLQVDDAAYYYFAAHIAGHPLDPYDFTIHWYQWPQHANHVLAPPVLLYWWAAGIRLWGDQPFLWKLWLLPFSLLFVFSLDALSRRFARGLERPLVWMTVLSPVFLPSLNLMLDVPALALALGSLTVFFRACERFLAGASGWWQAVVAGLMAGLAMQTKYTGFLAPVTMVLYALLAVGLSPGATIRLGAQVIGGALLAVACAVFVFVTWEAFVAWRHGESHFLLEMRHSRRNLLDQMGLVLPLLALVGGTMPTLALLGLTGLHRRWARRVSAAVMVIGYVVVVCLGGTITLSVYHSLSGLGDIVEPGTIISISIEQVIFTCLGLLVSGTLAAVAWSMLRVGHGGLWQPETWTQRRIEWFLVLWLGLEIAGYLALTPFGAVRRIFGVVVVGTLLAGRLAALTCRAPRRQVPVWGVALCTIILGLVYYGVDLTDARAAKQAAESAAAFVREREPQATIWYTGHWGFQFYAERAGMKAVIPDDLQQRLHRGDWLVVPEPRFEQQDIRLQSDQVELVAEVSIVDTLPLRTVRCFYGTGTGVPLEHHPGPGEEGSGRPGSGWPRFSVKIYRVRVDFVPGTPE